MRPVRLLVIVSVLATVAACSSTVTPTPSASASPSDAPSASPSVAASPAASPSEPVATPESVATPEATPVPSLSADEAELIGRLRVSAAADCGPRRTDLPAGALSGIECDPGDPLVRRVGVYRYATANDAAFAYLTRMSDAGIAPNTGDCLTDTAGDGAYFPGDGESPVDAPGVFDWEGKALVTQRNGCFVDEFDSANIRLVCENDYIGILGARADISDLMDWAWIYPDGYEPGTPDLPGLCIGPSIVEATP
jgi:hypothetical protein